MCAAATIQRYLPNMLKRMGFGLLLCLIREIADLVITVTANSSCIAEDRNVSDCFVMYSEIQVNGTCVEYMDVFNSTACYRDTSYHFLWLGIPFVLHGLSLLLVFMTTLEFICAQAPLRTKGVLVSLWYASQLLTICSLEFLKSSY